MVEKKSSNTGSRQEPDLEDTFGFGDENEVARPESDWKPVETPVVADDSGARSWRVAANMVNRYRPVPQLVWPIVHAVFGRPGELGMPDPMMYSTVTQLIIRASADPTLHQDSLDAKSINLTEAVRTLGTDVAAAICLVHAVCRRISSTVNERVSRPILDDALLRAHIGFYVGQLSPRCGSGRGIIAGFAGRCGLAVQIASGDKEQAGRALTGMASGQDMSEICNTVYGCDPLEVAALSYISGGCCREIAFGISSYSAKGKEGPESPEQKMWLALFSIIEASRMGELGQIDPQFWDILEYSEKKRQELTAQIVKSQRRGHGWQWLTQPQLAVPDETAEPAKTPEEIRQSRKK